MLRATRPAAAGLLLLAALAACKRENQGYAGGALDTARPAMPAPETAARMNPPASAAKPWSNPAIIGFAVTADSGEILLGHLAAKKATRADVKAFARQMVEDHTKMLSADRKLATRLRVMMDTSASDVRGLADDARNELKALSDKAAGTDWDKEYMDTMVKGHEAVLKQLQDAAQHTNDAEVKRALESAIPKVQAHLTKAREIQSKTS